MNWVDYSILVVILLSAVVGLLRGFVREALGLATWVLAFWLAMAFAMPVEARLAPHVDTPSIRLALAYAIPFLLGLIVGMLITALIVRLTRASVFSSPDRALGAGFGVARGIFVVCAFVLLAGYTPLKQDAWWQRSFMIPKFQPLADGLRALVPDRWLQNLQPSTDSSPISSS